MKIAVWHNLFSGGGSRALQNHICGLVERGHQVEIWAYKPDADGFMKLPSEIKLHKMPLERINKQDFTLKERFNLLFFEKEANMIAMEKHCQMCADEINKGGFDILFANSCSYYAVPCIGKYIKIPKVLYLGEPNRYLYEAMPKLPWAAPENMPNKLNLKFWILLFSDFWRINRLRVYVREEQKNFATFDNVLVNSYFSMESCQRVYGLASEVCYLGIDTELFRPIEVENPKEDFVVGLGSFHAHKNPILAIQAIAKITENRPKLVWICNSVDEDYLLKATNLAQEIGVKLEIKRLVSDDDLVKILNSALCMIYSSRLEPFGFAPLEANACGLPVVTIPEGGIRETIIDGKSGFFVSQTPEGIKGSIQQLIDNQELRYKIKDFAINNVKKNWTLSAATDRIEAALFKTIKLSEEKSKKQN